MKKCSLLLLAVLICVGIADVHAQSRRVPPQSSNEKANRRGAAPQATPTPAPTPDDNIGVEDSGEVISVDTKLVTIPVRILDRKNRFIGGLTKENFSVFEDGLEQEVAYFTNEAQPFTVALVLDMSYSTTFKIDEIQNAAIAFIGQLRPEDQVMVISFDEEVRMLCEPTSDRKRIYNAIRSTRIATGTSLYEAMDMTMNARLRSIKGRKAIVLFTDGVDTTSRTSHDRDNLRDAMELDALIYPIRYDTYADVQAMKDRPPIGIPTEIKFPGGIKIPQTSRPPVPQNDPRNDPFPGSRTGTPSGLPGQKGTTAEEYVFAEEYLDQLAFRTGGRTHLATTFGNLNSAFAKIASELREFYSIGYYPKTEPVPGSTRRIKVRVDQQNVVVKARDSYVVPKIGK